MEATPINRTTISEQIFEQLKESIIRGDLNPGDKLPSENQLCKMYGVSRTTIRQALATLSSLDLIETKVGEGSYVKSMDDGNVMAPIMSRAFLSRQSLVEIVEMRRLVEPIIAEYACSRATEEDIDKLREIYHGMEKSKNNTERFARLDCEFHIQVAKASGNVLITKMSEIISDILLSAFFDIVAQRGVSEGLVYHKKLLKAFAAGEAKEAKEIMQIHMDKMMNDLK